MFQPFIKAISIRISSFNNSSSDNNNNKHKVKKKHKFNTATRTIDLHTHWHTAEKPFGLSAATTTKCEFCFFFCAPCMKFFGLFFFCQTLRAKESFCTKAHRTGRVVQHLAKKDIVCVLWVWASAKQKEFHFGFYIHIKWSCGTKTLLIAFLIHYKNWKGTNVMKIL